MLLRYFGFREDPFGATPDPRFLYRSSTHREALASLQYGFYSNRGFTALIAPPGMGKTTLLFRFLEEIRESARSVFLFDTQCEPRELIRYILQDLGVTPGRDSVEMHAQLNDVLLAEARAGRKFVVVIDEAQNLSDGALETVRLLTNFETSRTKLMQIVLAGQPQLSDKLVSPSLLQLRQRISTVCRLERFSTKEMTAYIEHRLKFAGYHGAPLFTNDALNLIMEASQGIPRTINTLCFNALSLCCALKRKQVDGNMAAEVITDQQWLPQLRETSVHLDEILAPEQTHEVKRWWTALGFVRIWAPATAMLVLVPVLVVLGLFGPRTPWVHKGDSDSLALKTPPASAVSSAKSNTEKIQVERITTKGTPLEITVRPNQTLGNIAVQYLGNFDRQRLHQIQALNPDLVDTDDIQPGQKIRLPDPVREAARLPANVRSLP